jgi:hypothetical protein
MGPMAIPLFGGMLIEVMTMFITPVLFSMWKEAGVNKIKPDDKPPENSLTELIEQ